MKKRMLSVLLALVLVLTLLPFGSLAADKTVHVVAKNETFLTEQGGVNGRTKPAWTGIGMEADIPYTSGMTVYQALKKMPAADQVSGIEFADSGYGHYVTGVYGVHDSDVAKPNMDGTETKDGTYTILGGWMVTVNDWFCDTGVDSMTVQAGDVITLEYSLSYGADIGADWSSTDAGLKSLSLSAGALFPAFDPAVLDYTLYVPSDVSSLTVTATAANRNNKVTVLSDSEKEARWGARTIDAKDFSVAVESTSYDENWNAVKSTTAYKFDVVTVAPSASFSDVESGEFYADPVAWAVENGVTNGVGNNRFAPKENCTRGQIVTFLWRAMGSQTPSSKKNPFSDVKSGEFYYNAVLWAVENGITTGTDKTHFSPNDSCTRGQAVTFLHRALQNPKTKTTSSPFVDVKDKGVYYYTPVLWASESGVTTGTDKTHFTPDATCTRGQIVTFLFRALYQPSSTEQLADALLKTAGTLACNNGDWLVMDLARAQRWSHFDFVGYYDSVVSKAKSTKGKMDASYATDYARLTLAVTALGYDAANIGGYDLTATLQKVKTMTAQGVNGAIYALLALDSGNYPSAVRQDYVDAILAAQRDDGGFAWGADDPTDPDMTAMAIQALAPYMDQQTVGLAVEQALMCLSKLQQKDGGFFSWGASSCESTAQAILALIAAGVSLDNDAFVKNGNSLLDNLLTFQLKDGTFCHTKDDGTTNAYASEQALRALIAVDAAQQGVTFYGVR